MLGEEQLDLCTAALEERVGVTPEHFAYTWGISVPALEPAMRARFRSATTGELGRNQPGQDLMRLRRVPVRGTDPLAFFAAKLRGNLLVEKAYGGLVGRRPHARSEGQQPAAYPPA